MSPESQVGVSKTSKNKNAGHSDCTARVEAFPAQQGELLPGGAVHGGGGGSRAAAEVLLDALVVSDLSGDGDRRGLSPRGDHGGRRRGGLRLPAEPQREDGGFQPVRMKVPVIPYVRIIFGDVNAHNDSYQLSKATFFLYIIKKEE